ncbi:MAG TPA: hypothetical protein VD789_04900 [Thermomicrobiales bacterium]|nr:hypothetical protein [Thermomicrobiales bacterium]
MSEFRYVRVTSNAAGDSQFEDLGMAMQMVDYAPPAAPLDIATLGEATAVSVIRGSSNWRGEALHPVPARQWMFVLTGAGEVATSTGDRRTFGAGSAFLFEDTEGKGHSSRFFEEATIAVVRLDV